MGGRWWTRYIGRHDLIDGLSRDDLEAEYRRSCDAIQRQRTQEMALRGEIQDLDVEMTRHMTQSSATQDGVRASGSIAASQRRVGHLSARLETIRSDLERTETELEWEASKLATLAEAHEAELPFARESLLIGPFNIAKIRGIYADLETLRGVTEDPNDFDDYDLCMSLLSCDGNRLARKLRQRKARLDGAVARMQQLLEERTADAERLLRQIAKIRNRLSLIGTAASKRTLPDRTSQAGTLTSLRQTSQTLRATLRTRRSEFDQLTKQLAARNAEMEEKRGEIAEIVRLRQRRRAVELEQHRLENDVRRAISCAASARDLKADCKRDIAELKKQCATVENAIHENQEVVEIVRKLRLSTQDLRFLGAAAAKGLPTELGADMKRIRDRLVELDRDVSASERQRDQLAAQERQLDGQIAELRDFLLAGRASSRAV